MTINITTTHKCIFTVTASWGTEGGMDTESFGGEMETLEEAITSLALAKIKARLIPWVITVNVETVSTRSK